MSEVATTTVEQQPASAAPTAQAQEGQTDLNRIMAENLWNLNPTEYKPVTQQQPEPTTTTTTIAQEPPASTEQVPPVTTEPAATNTSSPADDIVGPDEFFMREFGMNAADFRTKWETLNKAPQTQEVKWSYDESKEDEIYNYLQQKRTLSALEKMEIADANQAAEIIRANLQFKYKDLQPAEIDRLFARQYALPQKPAQGIEQTDEDYAASIQQWEAVVSERRQDMIIDAKLAKPELVKFKSEIVQPDKPNIQFNQPSQPSQEELAAREAGRRGYLEALENSYQGFKGFSVTAKDGDVQLPINYSISPDELLASKKMIEDFNPTEFFDKRWFDGEKPRVNQIQEDLYLIMNRDKIFQAIANESATKRYEHNLKTQNNINLSGVNKNLGPNAPQNSNGAKTSNQALADSIWAL